MPPLKHVLALFPLMILCLGCPAIGQDRDAKEVKASAPKWGTEMLRRPDGWYATPEARGAAEAVTRFQSEHGGWPKNTNLLKPMTDEQVAKMRKSRTSDTIDNGATTLPIRFLARVASSTGDKSLRAAVERGVDYLLVSQYPNGGFPQFFPLRKGYYAHITYNDGAMINALELLRDVSEAREPFTFLDAERRTRAADAVARGIDCILRTQIRADGVPLAWCAQHDAVTFAPAWARAYEPPSLSGSESVGIVRFLMSIETPPPEVKAAIEGAVAWFERAAIRGKREINATAADGKPDRVLVDDPSAPRLWARFYDIETGAPLYMDRDSKPQKSFDQIDSERRVGYRYHGTWAGSLLEKDLPRWREKAGLQPVSG